MESVTGIVEEIAGPTCIDCDHAFELPDDITTVACGAHNVFRNAQHPASCEQYVPRQPLAGASLIDDCWCDEEG